MCIFSCAHVTVFIVILCGCLRARRALRCVWRNYSHISLNLSLQVIQTLSPLFPLHFLLLSRLYFCQFAFVSPRGPFLAPAAVWKMWYLQNVNENKRISFERVGGFFFSLSLNAVWAPVSADGTVVRQQNRELLFKGLHSTHNEEQKIIHLVMRSRDKQNTHYMIREQK